VRFADSFTIVPFTAPADAHRHSHGDGVGGCRRQEDASILSLRTQRHAGEQIRIDERAATRQRQPDHVPVRENERFAFLAARRSRY